MCMIFLYLLMLIELIVFINFIVVVWLIIMIVKMIVCFIKSLPILLLLCHCCFLFIYRILFFGINCLLQGGLECNVLNICGICRRFCRCLVWYQIVLVNYYIIFNTNQFILKTSLEMFDKLLVIILIYLKYVKLIKISNL